MELFTILWLALLIAFLVVEASTVTLISLWFAAGALAALIASLLHAPLWLQAVLFFAVSGRCYIVATTSATGEEGIHSRGQRAATKGEGRERSNTKGEEGCG